MLPDSVVNEFAREGAFGFSPDDERVTVSRREYTELVQSRQHAENMLKIIHDFETKCAQHEHELQKCKDVCIETCKRVESERDRQINSIVQRYETRFKDDQKRFETEFVQLRAQYNVQVTKMSQQYEHSVSLLKQHNISLQHELHSMKHVKPQEADPFDWYSDGKQGVDPKSLPNKVPVYSMDKHDHDVASAKGDESSFESCGSNLNAKLAKVVGKYSQTHSSSASAVNSGNTLPCQDTPSFAGKTSQPQQSRPQAQQPYHVESSGLRGHPAVSTGLNTNVRTFAHNFHHDDNHSQHGDTGRSAATPSEHVLFGDARSCDDQMSVKSDTRGRPSPVTPHTRAPMFADLKSYVIHTCTCFVII